MANQIGFLDLDYLRVGIFLGKAPTIGMPETFTIKYRPPGLIPFRVEKIPNVSESNLLYVTNEQLGGISTFPAWVILLRGDKENSPFLVGTILKKYAELVEKFEDLKLQMQIKKGAEISKSIQLSRDIMSEVERIKRINESLGSTLKVRKRREFIGFGGE